MTNEQLTQEVISLKEHQAKAIGEHEKFELILKELQEDVKSTKTLAEDVHIMAINMKNMQETLNETNKKVDILSNKEFNEYTENKKLIKDKTIGAIAGSIGTMIFGAIVKLVTLYFKGGI